MNNQEPPDAELMEIFGGTVQPIEADPDEVNVGMALQDLRAQIIDAAKEDGVGVNRLARRLHVAPSSVSRALSDGGDMRVSTLVLYATALGRSWDFHLRKASCHISANHHAGHITMLAHHNDKAVPETAGAPVILVISPPRYERSIAKWVEPART